jgi:hypothetical protein
MKNSTVVLALVLGFQTACTFSFKTPANAGIFDSIKDEVENQIPDVGGEAGDIFKDATDNKSAASLDVHSITVYDTGVAEVRVVDSSGLLYYEAKGDAYDLLLEMFGFGYQKDANFVGALDGSGKTKTSEISEVWKSLSDLDLFEGNFALYLKYNADAAAYKTSDEYKQKLEEAEQQNAQ